MQYRGIVTTCATAVGLVAVLTAQYPPATAPAPQATADKAQSLTGCVTPGTQTGTFMLSNIAAAPASPTAPATTGPGSAAARESAMSPDKTYKLVVTQAGGVDLAAHAGHKVTVTGVVRPAPAASSGTETDKVRSFEVQALRMVATTCS
jgi:hypothetical protein